MKRQCNIKLLFFAAIVGFGLSGCVNNDGEAALQTPESPSQSFPLYEYLDAVWGTSLSPEARRLAAEQTENRRTDIISQCMHDAGFEYDPDNLPGIWVGTGLTLFGDEEGWDPTNRDWIAQWGYGIVDSPLGGGITENRAVFSGPTELPEHNLSEAEQAAFSRALLGPPCEEYGIVEDHGAWSSCSIPEDWTWRQMMQVGGCQGLADLQISDESSSGLVQSDEFASLFDAIWEMQSDFRSEITQADRDWAACMADEGYANFELRSDAEDLIWRRLDNATTPTARNNLQAQEVEIALADYDCRIAVDFEARRNARRIEVETQFVSDHLATLTALRDAAEQRATIGN